MPQNGASGRHSISLISREADRLPNIPDFVYRAKRKKEIKKRKERKIERKERMKKEGLISAIVIKICAIEKALTRTLRTLLAHFMNGSKNFWYPLS